MDIKTLPQRWRARGYTDLGIDTLKIRIPIAKIEEGLTRRPSLGASWTVLHDRPSGEHRSWRLRHPGLDTLAYAKFDRLWSGEFNGSVTLELSVATIYTHLETGVALNVLPAPLAVTAGIVATLIDEIVIRGVGVPVASVPAVEIIRMDAFVDFWFAEVGPLLGLLRQLPPMVPRTKGRDSRGFADPAAGRLGVTMDDRNSLLEYRTGAGKQAKGRSGHQANAFYDRALRVRHRIQETFFNEIRAELLSDKEMFAYLRGQVRFEARHGQETRNSCRAPSAYYSSGGAKVFKGQPLVLGDISGTLLRSILQGRLQEKGLGPDASLVVAQTHAAIVREVLDARGTRSQACQLAHICDVGHDAAKLQGFEPRRLVREIRDRTGKMFALARDPGSADVAPLLWRAASASPVLRPDPTDWTSIEELVRALGIEIKGTGRKRRHRNVPEMVVIGFEDDGDLREYDAHEFDEASLGPDIAGLLAEAVSVGTVPQTLEMSVSPSSRGVVETDATSGDEFVADGLSTLSGGGRVGKSSRSTPR